MLEEEKKTWGSGCSSRCRGGRRGGLLYPPAGLRSDVLCCESVRGDALPGEVLPSDVLVGGVASFAGLQREVHQCDAPDGDVGLRP